MSEAVIGRDDELESIRAFVDSAPEGPAAFLIEGEPGIGKTTVWREGVAGATERGQLALEARPAAVELDLSFAGLADLFRDVLDDVLPALPPPQRRALEIALLLTDAPSAAPDRRTTGAAVLGVLGELTRDRPVLMAIDDVQWLDPASSFALAFAVRRLRGEPVRLLLAARTDTQSPSHDLLDAFGRERLDEVRLGPLSAGAINHLLRTQLGAALPRPLFRRLFEISGGNPFFALELGRALMARGGQIGPGEELPVEGGLKELVRTRIGGLPDSTQQALATASAVAQPTIRGLGAIIGDLDAVLAPAVDSRVVEIDGDRIRFTHPLLAAGVYDALRPTDRQALHSRLAGVVEDREERARHLARSTSHPDATVAQELDAAARSAAARGAPQAAAELAEEAWRLTPSTDRDDSRRRRLEAAEYQLDMGDPGRARTLIDGALAQEPSGSARAEVLFRLARVIDSAGMYAEAVALLEEALREADERDVALRALCRRELADLARLTRGLEAAEAHAREAVALAEKQNDAPLLSRTLVTLARIEFNGGKPGARATAKRAVAVVESQELFLRDDPRMELVHQLLWSGEFAAACTQIGHVRESARGRDEVFDREPLWYLSLAELRVGRWQSAAEHADAAVEMEIQFGRESAGTFSPQALVAASRGDIDRARTILGHSLALAEANGDRPITGMQLAIVGFLELSCGNLPAALEALGRAHAIGQELRFREPGMPFGLDDYLEARIAAGEIEGVDELLGPWESRARILDRAPALARAERVRGLLASAGGDTPTALAAFERALAHHDRGPEPFERGRTLLALGQVQRRAKQRRAGRETLEKALAIFEELGAAIWAERARSELARIGGRAPSSGELTPMERRVADLVAAGKSNREIAGELVVALRTVETHLSRIYRKLGVRSRTQLAARVTEGTLTHQ